jgi:hypothetical protein
MQPAFSNFCVNSCSWLMLVWSIYPGICYFWCPDIETSSVDLILLCMIITWWRRQSTVTERSFKITMMGSVQKANHFSFECLKTVFKFPCHVALNTRRNLELMYKKFCGRIHSLYFILRDWGKSRKMSLRIAGVLVEVITGHLRNRVHRVLCCSRHRSMSW